jgi:hypothetical protein
VVRSEYYIVVSSANGGAFARVGPYQSEDDAKKAASFSAIKRYRIEQQGRVSLTPRGVDTVAAGR